MPWWKESASCSREQSDQRVGDVQPLYHHHHHHHHDQYFNQSNIFAERIRQDVDVGAIIADDNNNITNNEAV